MVNDDRLRYYVATCDEQVITLHTEPFADYVLAMRKFEEFKKSGKFDNLLRIVSFEICN